MPSMEPVAGLLAAEASAKLATDVAFRASASGRTLSEVVRAFAHGLKCRAPVQPLRPGFRIRSEVLTAHEPQKLNRGLPRALMLGADVGKQEVRRPADQLPRQRGSDLGGGQELQNSRKGEQIRTIEQRRQRLLDRLPPDRAASAPLYLNQPPQDGPGKRLNSPIGIRVDTRSCQAAS